MMDFPLLGFFKMLIFQGRHWIMCSLATRKTFCLVSLCVIFE